MLVKVARAGQYWFNAFISDGQHYWLPMHGLDTVRDRAMRLSDTELDAGAHTVAVYFDGQALRESGMDGPYTIAIYVYEAGSKDPSASISFSTFAYKSRDFQGLLIENLSLTDRGVDIDGVPGYDVLRVSAHFNMAAVGTVGGHAILFGGGRRLQTLDLPEIQLDAGPQTVDIDFSGERIWAFAADGPYAVNVELRDQTFPASEQRYTTAAYTPEDFQPPIAHFSRDTEEMGSDLDGDGGYNVLRFNVGVSVTKAGRYNLSAGLHDAQGNFLAVAQTEELSLEVGRHTLDLDFSGATLGDHKTDGPYHLGGLEVSQEGGEMLDVRFEDYLTAAYPYNAFRPAGPMFSDTNSDTYSDQGVDTNGNGLYENLTIKVEVSIVKAGQYDFNAALSDNSGRLGKEIVRAVGQKYLEVGEQWIALEFDGRYIYGQQVNGPYRMQSFMLYSNYPEQVLGEGMPVYTTGPYDWHQFEPGVSISGTVSAAGQPLDQIVVYIGGIDMDETDESGRYRLTALDTGPVTIGIDPEPGPWQIWVNGKLETVGNSVTIQAVVGTPIEVNFVKAP